MSRLSIIKVGRTVLRGIYALMKARPMRGKVTILSRQSDGPSMDIALLSEYLRVNHPDLKVVALCRSIEGRSKVGYGFHVLRQMWHMACSAVIVLDGYCISASILHHRDEVTVVQMWHASAAIKKFGYQTLDKPGGRSREIAEIMCMHRNYDVILSPSEATGDHFSDAFMTDRSKIRIMALPRIDVIMAGDGGNGLRAEYGIPDDREVILYAPTFRKASGMGTQIGLDGLVQALDKMRYTLVICPHPLDRSTGLEDEGVLSRDNVIVDRNHGTYEWLSVCDSVITDYSALAVEASLTDKPLYFYVYDIEEYSMNEGLNVDPRIEVPEITAEDPEALARLMDEEYPRDILKRFREKYFEADRDNSTEKLGEYIYGLAKKNN